MSKLTRRKLVDQFGLFAASEIGQFVPVTLLGGASSQDDKVTRAGSWNDIPVGLTLATVAANKSLWVVMEGVSPAIAAASLGVGAPVAVGSTNGRLVPLLPSGLSTALGSALGAQGLRFAVGFALQSARDGDPFRILVTPRQLV